jgi:hypothetical protein
MYSYATQKGNLFTDHGQRLFVGMRDRVLKIVKQAGAIRAAEAMLLPDGIGAADGWDLLAALDRMVELGDLREIPQADRVAGQHRVFVAGRQQ